MKYFTPERFVQLQECEDKNAFRVIHAAWERAIVEYRQSLDTLRSGPRDGVREFLKRKSLHDARVMDIGVSDTRLTIVLQEPIGAGLVSLTYALVDSPLIDRSAIPELHCSSPTSWLYDEFDREDESLLDPELRLVSKISGPTKGEQPRGKPVFLHSILLSNGWEIRVRFHRILVTRTTSLFRSPEFSPRAEALTHSV